MFISSKLLEYTNDMAIQVIIRRKIKQGHQAILNTNIFLELKIAADSQCNCIDLVNIKTVRRLCYHSIPDLEILKNIKTIPLNRGSNIYPY